MKKAMTSAELRAALAELGISQRQLARDIGHSHMAVSRWALDKTPVPRLAAAYVDLRLQIARRAVDTEELFWASADALADALVALRESVISRGPKRRIVTIVKIKEKPFDFSD